MNTQSETTSPASPAVRRYLDRLRPFLPLRDGNDILRELESTIHDRVEDLAERERREPDEALFERAVAELGTPETIAASFEVERYLVGPASYGSFLFYTALLFALHLMAVGISTSLGRPLHLGVFEVAPLGPNGLFSLLGAAVKTLLLDVGLMALVFGAAGALKRDIEAPWTSFRVDAAPRPSLARAALALASTVILNWLRMDLFVVVADGAAHPLPTAWFGEVMPLITWLLVLAAAKDLAYALFGERRLTLGADAVHGVLGMVLTVHMIRGEALLAVPALRGLPMHVAVNSFLDQLGTLVLAVVAFLFAVKTLRRAVRFAQIGR